VQVFEKTVAASSARWVRWTTAYTLSPFDLTPRNGSPFLDSQPTTKATEQRQLSALRKLVEMLAILDYTDPHGVPCEASLKRMIWLRKRNKTTNSACFMAVVSRVIWRLQHDFTDLGSVAPRFRANRDPRAIKKGLFYSREHYIKTVDTPKCNIRKLWFE
jgi:hypothetical protein